jgi:Putative Flp pilus-assembly TadE/G-like
MTPVAKSTKFMTSPQNQKGQISIFFSASLVVLISIVAFVINVGLFVKAKINLQNATDAAAFAGAAVQARQLTKIGHLNWEMRNIFKEWMYKYYVVGNLNLTNVQSPAASGTMSFNMEPDVEVLAGNRETKDPFNFPSVCIHLDGSQTNICKRYAIPGLPEFGSSNLPGADEASRAFQDALISSKVNDCVERSKLNMMSAAMWAYNVLTINGSVFAQQGPAIMADRQGAWPQAVELALRIRNLERIVNRETRDGSVCISPGASSKISCQTAIDQVSNEGFMGNERLVKAFYSGFRNIGGSADDDEMKSSFALTELPPASFREPSASNASNLLIPSPYDKQFLDLKLMSVNYAIFYSAMIPRAQSDTSGACDVSKSAIPIPGYPLGFYKNPEILTYYAVKGEAEFVGMFNPFGGEPVVLTAFAAAKPMGGRIGPMLFTHRETDSATVGRNDSNKRRSIPYITTFDIVGSEQRLPNFTTRTYEKREIIAGEYGPGVVLPVNGASEETQFWLTDEEKPVGGRIADASGVQFGIPNLAYDYDGGYSASAYSRDTSKKLNKIVLKDGDTAEIGLYSASQFTKFKGSLAPGSVSLQTLDREIARVRAATTYDAANYLIPIPFDEFANSNLGHFGQIPGSPEDLGGGLKRYRASIYAPLFGGSPSELLFKDESEVVSTIASFMREQETGIKKYKVAMNKAAIEVFKQKALSSQAAGGAAEGYETAARGISDLEQNDFNTENADANPKSCASLLGNFLSFYWSPPVGPAGGVEAPTGAGCPDSLHLLLQTYYSTDGPASGNFSADHYKMSFSWFPGQLTASTVPNQKGMLSAYIPGPFTGVSNDGIFDNLSTASSPELMRRNFYSTKLVSLNSLKERGIYRNDNFAIMSEGDTANNVPEIVQKNYKNPLQVPPEAENIKH